jgi:serine phosphatase RsbU (regulator of sigma subunit)
VPAGSLPLGDRLLTGEGPEFAGLLARLSEAVFVRDGDGRVVYANATAQRWFGDDSLLGKAPDDLLHRFRILDERGRPVSRAMLPGEVLLATGREPPPLLVALIPQDTGETRWYVLRAHAVRDDGGGVAAVATMIQDVSAEKTAEMHLRILAQSGRLLASSLDYQQTLRNVAWAAVPALADWCLVELIDGATREQVVVAHVDPEQRALAAGLRALEPDRPGPESAVHRVLISGEAELHREVSDAQLRQVAVSAEQLEVYRALGIRSALVVPMTVPGRAIGVMSFFTSVSGRRLGANDVAVAEQLARRAAVAVENARLHTTLGDVAATLQQSLRPAAIPEVAGWEIGALYRPALDEPRIEVGGDFYEVFDTSGNGFAMIGDVTGHGVRAATLTSLLRHGARFASHLEPDPVAIIHLLDEELRRRDDGAMATALCAALHDHRLLVCSAGHPPALIVDPSGEVRETAPGGPLLGAFTDSAWHSQQVPVSDGEIALLYTDGVTETVGADDRFGTARLASFLSRHAGREPQALLRALESELDHFRGGPASADVAALALTPR